MGRRLLVALAVLSFATAVSAAQGPARGQQAPPSAPVSQGPAATAQTPRPTPPPPAATYTYQAEGRRDPFVSLLTQGPAARVPAQKVEGAAGLSVAEISVRGTLQKGDEMVAMIQGPDNKTYIVHQGDKLLDGTIKTITSQGLVIVQEVNDPLSLVPTREVRKLLRSFEQAKE
jgi:Tfp pilus assembly protein PilP